MYLPVLLAMLLLLAAVRIGAAGARRAGSAATAFAVASMTAPVGGTTAISRSVSKPTVTVVLLLLVFFVLSLQCIFSQAAGDGAANGTEEAMASLMTTIAAEGSTAKSAEKTTVLWVVGIAWLDACSWWWVAARSWLLI